MEDKIGETFTGLISGITNFGLFVELENTIEGLVHVSYLTDDYYHYDEKHYAMIGERTGHVFRIGDEIDVRVINVNVEEAAIDFEVVGMKKRERKPAASRPKVIEGGKRKQRRKKGTDKPRTSSGLGQRSEGKARNKKKKPFYENAPSVKRKKRRKRRK